MTQRILFMGTPDFAVPSLAALHETGAEKSWELVAVATQPDRPVGRSRTPAAGPVKQAAQRYGIPVLQPERLRKTPEAVQALRDFAPDLIVVAAYGLILPRSVLEISTYGCINIHASLLPAYRGASPITAALLDGLSETGISIMLMDEGLDTGPVLTQATALIHPDDTTLTLTQRLANLGATLLTQTLPAYLAGQVAPIPQSELPGDPSVCGRIQKEDGRIDWTQSATQIERMTRAYTPWPGAYTLWQGQPFKIVQATVRDDAAGNKPTKTPPGTVLRLAGGVAVTTGEGLLELAQVQPAGKRSMDIQSFLNGAPDFIGAQLGT
jgi:methionyl-tRNA formyltransferase